MIKRKISDLQDITPDTVLGAAANGKVIEIPITNLVSGNVGNELLLTSSSNTDLIGEVNSVNTVFTVPEGSYVPGETEANLNGQKLTLDTQYEETNPVEGMITFADAPRPGSNPTLKYNSTGTKPTPRKKVIVNLGSGAEKPQDFNPVNNPFSAINNEGEMTNVDRESTGIILTMEVSGDTFGGAVANNIANTGVKFGSTTFDKTLENDVVYGSALFAASDRTITYVFTGFDLTKKYDFAVVGARTNDNSQRRTLVTVNNLVSKSIYTDIKPADSPTEFKNIAPVDNGEGIGEITVVQSTVNGDPTYLNGIQFSI